MNYLSIEFVIFIIATLTVYYLWPRKYIKYRYLLLLFASYFFIVFYNWRHGLFVVVSTLVSFASGLLTTHSKAGNHEMNRRIWPMVFSIVINVGLLVIVKYFNWFNGMVTALVNQPQVLVKFIIPLGISFYTFTLVAYNVDVWRGKFAPETNFLKFATFVSFFPKLMQGPIMYYDELAHENEGSLFTNVTFHDVDFLASFQRFVLGLLKKVLIADIIGVYVNYIWGNTNEVPGMYFPIVAILYAIQLYCDFSGYMDMSLGIAGLFGIKLLENFNVPYLSKTVQEFWGRWHISLGRWFTYYVYIPLGGNRVSKQRWAFNIMAVWFLSGIWHGADWTFVLWGLYFGVLLVIGRLSREKNKEKYGQHSGNFANSLRVVRTFILITIGWSIFSAPNISTYLSFVKRFLRHPFDGSLLAMFNDQTLAPIYFVFAILLVIALVTFYYFHNIKGKFNKVFAVEKWKLSLSFIFNSGTILAAIYLIVILGGLGASASEFIYFNF